MKNNKIELIYIKESDIPLTKTRQDLIRKFLRGVSYTSYTNPECTNIQCENGKYRSLTELHSIVLSRFPSTTFEAIVRIVFDMIEKETTVILVFCTTVQKVVVMYKDNKSASWISNHSKKYYYDNVGVDGYSLRMIEEIKDSFVL